MGSLSDRLEAAIRNPTPAARDDHDDGQPSGPSRVQTMLAEAACRQEDDRRRAQLIAEAEADPEVAAILAALPGAKVREVRLRWEPEESPAPPEIVDDEPEEAVAEAVDAADMSVIEESVTREYEVEPASLLSLTQAPRPYFRPRRGIAVITPSSD